VPPGHRTAATATHAVPLRAEPTDPLPTELPLLLAMGFRHLVDRLHDRLREEGREALRPAHGYVFRLLTRTGGSNVVEIAAHLEVTKQAASQVVAELEQWGYVERRPDAHDRRAVTVTLTDKGVDYVRHVDSIYAELERDWAAQVGAERVEQLRADLRTLLSPVPEGGTRGARPLW